MLGGLENYRDDLEKNETEMRTALKSVSESAIFQPQYLEKARYVLFRPQREKPFVFQNGACSESEPSFQSPDFEKGLRTDFIGLTDVDSYNEFDTEDPGQFGDRQYIQTLFLRGKIPFDEFVAHETGHNVFDLSYKAANGDFDMFELRDEEGNLRDMETGCSPEYIAEIKQKISLLLAKHGIQINPDEFHVNRQKIAEIFALTIQREYAKRANSPYGEHRHLENRVRAFLSAPASEIERVNRETGRKLTLSDFFTENHVLSFIVIPCLEREYPDFRERQRFFELNTRKYIN